MVSCFQTCKLQNYRLIVQFLGKIYICTIWGRPILSFHQSIYKNLSDMNSHLPGKLCYVTRARGLPETKRRDRWAIIRDLKSGIPTKLIDLFQKVASLTLLNGAQIYTFILCIPWCGVDKQRTACERNGSAFEAGRKTDPARRHAIRSFSGLICMRYKSIPRLCANVCGTLYMFRGPR